MEIQTVLLITQNRSSEAIAMIQSGRTPFPRIISVHTPEALEEAWNRQKDGSYFYHSIMSIGVDQSLIDKKNELGIEDGEYQKPNIKKETQGPRVCSRCHGSKVDPHHFQDDCQRCGGTGTVYGDESKWTPPQFVD